MRGKRRLEGRTCWLIVAFRVSRCARISSQLARDFGTEHAKFAAEMDDRIASVLACGGVPTLDIVRTRSEDWHASRSVLQSEAKRIRREHTIGVDGVMYSGL